MIFSRMGKVFRSIHTRLLIAIVVSGLGIHALLLGALFAHQAILKDALRSSVAQYVQYLVKDFGSPPDFNRTVEIAGRTGMIIHYFSPETNWSTSGKPPTSLPMERFHKWREAGQIETVRFDGRHYLLYQVDPDHRFLFEVVGGPVKDKRLIRVGLLVVILVTLLLTGAYLWIRRITAPLRPLAQGVREVGAGHLDHRVPIRCLDELGELAAAFNHMAERLQHLIRSKEQMLLDVSHELRSPLTRMKIGLEMSPEGAMKESLADDIVEMERMVTTILDNARAQSGKLALDLQRLDLVPLIREAIKPFEDRLPGVCLKDRAEPAEAFVDREKVKTVLRNVVGNAIKYSKETSGSVSIRVRAESESCTIEIQDEGIGISEQDLSFVFEPFYRVDRSRSRETGGFGLGLSLCKAIMEAHGGSISLQSDLEKGTTVELHFPRGHDGG